jgi:DNA-binding GntR family transcriptional regulator
MTATSESVLLPTVTFPAQTHAPAGKTAVIRGVIHGLLSGQFLGGQRLTEQTAAELFNVSRTPVREAMLELNAMGITQLKRNCGAVLRPFGPNELRDVYAVRALLEVEAARLAASRIPQETVERLLGDFQILSNQQRPDIGWQKDRELHSALALASGNPRLAGEISRYNSLVQTIREAVDASQSNLQERSIQEHLAILHACRDRDPARAASAMQKHLAQALESALQTLDQRPHDFT